MKPSSSPKRGQGGPYRLGAFAAAAAASGLTKRVTVGSPGSNLAAQAASLPVAQLREIQEATVAQIMRGGARIMNVQVPPGMSAEELPSVAHAAGLPMCLPCDSRSGVVAVGVYTDSLGKLFFPMCSECFDDYHDPAQERYFADVIRRRVDQIGEVQS